MPSKGIGLAGLLVAGCLVACGERTTRFTDASSAASGGGSTAGNGGAGGDGGAGGEAPTVEFQPFNGCNPNALVDETGKSEVEIQFGFIDSKFVYVPACVHVSVGTTVTFRCAGPDPCDFLVHPLQGGTQKEDPNSPFGFTNDAGLKEKSFVMDERGSFPYVCTAHIGTMKGAVYVD